jgi:hypothetical protein
MTYLVSWMMKKWVPWHAIAAAKHEHLERSDMFLV